MHIPLLPDTHVWGPTSYSPCISSLHRHSYKLNLWDVGGQKSLRSYWRNYFEETDGLIWVRTVGLAW